MRVLSLLNPAQGATRPDFEAHSLEEEKRVWALYSADTIRNMYFQPDPIRVALIFEAESVRHVEELVASFPMVKAGLLQADYMHLGPWLPFQALFGQQATGGAA